MWINYVRLKKLAGYEDRFLVQPVASASAGISIDYAFLEKLLRCTESFPLYAAMATIRHEEEKEKETEKEKEEEKENETEKEKEEEEGAERRGEAGSVGEKESASVNEVFTWNVEDYFHGLQWNMEMYLSGR